MMLLSVRVLAVREFRHGGIGGIPRHCELASTETKKTGDSVSTHLAGISHSSRGRMVI